MRWWKSIINKHEDLIYKDKFFSALQEYGEIEETREFDVSINGKRRKYFIVTTNQTNINLVYALKEQVWYSFFFFEGPKFQAYSPLEKWKKEIYYRIKELDDPWFFLSLFHEVSHFPLEDQKNDPKKEKECRLKAIWLAKALKTNYNICFLAGFKNHESVYDYTRKFIRTYERKFIK
jgi:hypothetical protein